jgi:hypothetical protein
MKSSDWEKVKKYILKLGNAYEKNDRRGRSPGFSKHFTNSLLRFANIFVEKLKQMNEKMRLLVLQDILRKFAELTSGPFTAMKLREHSVASAAE